MAHIEKYYEKSSQGGGGGGGLSWSHDHDRIAIGGKQQDNTHNDEKSNSNNDGPWATAIEDATAYAFVTAVADDDNDNDNKHNGHNVDNDDYRDDIMATGRATTTTRPSPSLSHNKGEKMLHSVDQSLLYLEVLRELLEKQENWEWVPYPCYPPTFADVINSIIKKKKAARKNKKNKKKSRRSRFTTGRNDGLTTTTSKFNNLNNNNNNNSSNNPSSDTETTSFRIDTTTSTKSSSNNAKSRKNKTITTHNRFASIAATDSDSDDGDDVNDDTFVFDKEEEEEEGEEDVIINNTSTTIEDHNRELRQLLSAEASPYSPTTPQQQQQQQHQPQQQEMMDTLRLLVRLYASQSDLYSKKARILATQSQWLPGAGALQSSIVALARGLELADAEVSKTLAVGTAEDDHPSAASSSSLSSSFFTAVSSQDNKANNDRRVQLEQDADIVHVSTKYLVQEKDKYLKTATRQVAKLARILEEMYRKREEAKKKLGVQQWNNNDKSSKGVFAKKREKHERELRSLEEALQQLEGTNEDASTLVDEARRLREKLREARYRKHRYNGRPPSSTSSSLLSSYPVASTEEFGWTFTGSMEGRSRRGRRDVDDDFVEFFEKQVSIDNNNNNNNDDNF
ncbi:hypothetical protein FRACYDRAFT_232029 [Fragilariopsis cylindrus CCMP1102]|uniref:Uncharacterized protein n=1 Tax=Fragilariopsis cylindrus CCMP1102 TaxID=635003 RepID=A0A1E7FUU8_9STRA|nr:hypothetical protein FRACYDRAFT_232029 [Fragilariopsis cylindrus CCMP1102]|eukprot:OEU21885.1 hypothetical protein FRACYDRAFT_232029 [Fragilariopsis cylindrus CCMP1102]